jgi:hypothetical protein
LFPLRFQIISSFGLLVAATVQFSLHPGGNSRWYELSEG